MAKTPAREYPRVVWVLTPSYKPKDVVVVKKYNAWGDNDYGDITESGKRYAVADMHPTQAAAIAEGHAQLDVADERNKKQALAISAKRHQLDLAAGKK